MVTSRCGHGDANKSPHPTRRQTSAPKIRITEFHQTVRKQTHTITRAGGGVGGGRRERERELAYKVRNTIELEQLNRAHNKGKACKDCNHCSPTTSRCDHIFSLIPDKQVAVRVKMRAFFSRTTTPLAISPSH